MRTLVLSLLLAAPAVAGPNVVFILADDLGVNDLGCYGRKDHRTPNLDRLAKDGQRFTAAYAACPVCSPTRAAILTGKHPARLHLTTFLPGRKDAASQKLLHPAIAQQLPLGEVTLAERLKAAGYATACVGKWHLGGAKFGPGEQGFDTVYAGKANTPPTDAEGGKSEFDLTAKAIEFVTANKSRPFFLHLAHNAPHIPLAARKDLIERNAGAFNPLYAAVIESLDASVGKLLDALDGLKLRENTLVAFTSDNGGLHVPELKDDPPTHNTPYRAGKGFLYEGGIRVPLIVRWPGTTPAGRVCDAIVTSTDWTRTLCAACDVSAADTSTDGDNFLPLLEKRADRDELFPPRARFWHVPHYTNQGSRPAGAVRDGDWKLIEHYEDGKLELFDLAADPGEQTDLSAKERAKALGLREKLAAWRASVRAQANQPNPAFDAARHRELYADVDVSDLKPAATAAATGAPLKAWRTRMDAATAK